MMFDCNILHQHGIQQMNLTHSSSLHQGSCHLLPCQCSSDCAYILPRLCTPGAYSTQQSWLGRLLNYLTSYRPNRLPAPLYSHSSILEPTAVFRDDTEYHKVVAVEPHFIVKYGRGIKKIEGQVLLFLEHHLKPCRNSKQRIAYQIRAMST